MQPTDLYRLVYEIVTEAMIVVDAKGIILDANPATSNMFNYPLKSLVGMNVDELLPDGLKKIHAKHRKDYAKDPQKRTMGTGMELSGMDSNGKLIPVEVSLNHATFDGELRVVALITDITTRKEAEQRILQANKELEEGVRARTKELKQAVQALEESQHLHSLIAQNFPDGTINVLDKKLNYIFADGKEFARSGIDRTKVIGLNYISLLPQQFRPMVESELKKVFSGTPRTFEIVSRGNTYIMNAVPLYDQDKDVDRVLLVEKNITEQKRLEQDMISALKKERELNELKSRFVSMASHEFRTPLATVLSSINLVKKHAERGNQESVSKHVNRIKSSVRNLTTILNDFLSLEKLESGKVNYNPDDFDLAELVHSVVEDIEQTAKVNQQIHVHCDDCVNVHLDEHLLRNVLFNLLSNAVKYSDENGEITLSVKSSEERVTIAVQDQGIGIPESEHVHLFERFFRAKNATNIQGTGLGLNIVKKHVELMGGSIDFESKLNVGTTFTIILPTNQPSNQ